MAFFNLTPITRDLSDEAMPIGDLSAAWKDPLREFGAAAKTVFNDFAYRLRPAQQNPSLLTSAKPIPSSSTPIASSPSVSDPIDYLDADLAKHYGMSAQTAYAEAMSNTAYQRAVKDMRAAGLNPALLAQHGFAQPASGGFAGSQVGSAYGRSGGSSAKSVSKFSGLWQGLASLATAGAVFGLTKGSLGAVGAAVTAKTLATVAGQAAKAIAK